ncbi:MAG: DUF4145 domain-containing protein [Gemmatimonas sp.]|nr:DUF4145 domain-containing protein [Gemmatimonas sp.]
MKKSLPALDDLNTLVRIIASLSGVNPMNSNGGLHCMSCGDVRRMTVTAPNGTGGKWTKAIARALPEDASEDDRLRELRRMVTPSIVEMKCTQCYEPVLALLYRTMGEDRLAIIPRSYGGASTPNTPREVAYYLDQAHKAHSMGANTAAVGMLRVALEHVLHGQGFEDGQLGRKLGDLEKRLQNGNAPKWAENLDIEEVTNLKDLGNAALHSNNGDISVQDAFDSKTFRICSAIISDLLEAIYERPAKLLSRKTYIADVREGTR